MTPRLLAELRRLFLPDTGAWADGPAELPPPAAWADAEARVRALVLAVTAEAGWEPLAAVWQGVQAELGWPAPGIAVDGRHGLQLWFSLAQPVPADAARAVLGALRQRWLAALPAHRTAQWPALPGAAEVAAIDHLPPRQIGDERWSAFVAPDLAPVFADTPWLEIPPGDDAQASLLARLQSASAGAWDEACARLAPRPAPLVEPVAPAGAQASRTTAGDPAATAVRGDADPGDNDRAAARRFLRAVMDDPGAPLAQRIEAARALLGPGQAG